jgi:hypothetical protein
MVAAQGSNQITIGLVEMKVSRELVGQGFAIEAGKALPLGVGKVTGRHALRNFQLMRRGRPVPKCNVNIFANHMCETKVFCSKFRTTFRAAA